MNKVHEGFQEVFRDVFDDDTLLLTEQTTADDVEGWDSLAHINLVIAIERYFHVKFATAEISRLKDNDSNVGGMMTLVERKLAAQ